MTSDEVAALEKFILAEINALRREMNLQFAAIDEARSLQAAEYSRRLETLNHESQRIREVQGLSVSKELYDSHYAQIVSQLRALELRDSNVEGKATQTSVMIAWGLGFVGAASGVLALFLRSG